MSRQSGGPPASQKELGPWEKELDDLVRAFSGAFLFGVPLLFTMEMWWIGIFIDRPKLLALLAVAFATNLGLAYFAGFRQEESRSLWANASQAVHAVAVGVVGSVIVLLALNRIAIGDPLDSILGKIIVQAVPLSIGASVATFLFAKRVTRQGDEAEGGQGGQGGEEGEGRGPQQAKGPVQATLFDAGATFAGAIFIGASIAPTDEIQMLASQLDYWHELAVIGLSLVVTYAIVFESGFDPQRGNSPSQSIFGHPITETAAAYIISLLVALGSLYLLDRIEIGDDLGSVTSQVLVLGLPAAVGGAAGRIAI